MSPFVGASPAATPDDVQVATVNGRPVWGSCVTRQVTGGKARTATAALHDCVDFELLAQEAERRGLAADPELVDAWRTTLVDRLVATAYEAKHRTPADFGNLMIKALADNDQRRHRPEYRASTFLRVTITPTSPDKSFPLSDPRDAAARAIADKLAAEVAPETGLMAPHLTPVVAKYQAEAATAKLAIEQTDVPPYAMVGLEKAYAGVLFGIPEIGRTAGPVRTKWGWDVILWTGVVPARDQTVDELAADILPRMRREYFPLWVKQLEQSLNLHIEYIDANLPLLEEGS
ncbi:MAG: hypothetical protein NT062_01405 [Proteobacteria bacterium]|nr:hypothetical protein [Pseudomonadota bacterium]